EVPGAAPQHGRQKGADHQERAAQVGGQHAVEVLGVGAVQRGERERPRGPDDQVRRVAQQLGHV
ncbi:MAG: hypothetical protein AVDCRST_MAG89-4480, partial [uncultured Gemmatimonadetes bacterium]